MKYRHVLPPWQLGYNNSGFIFQQLTFSSPSQHFLGIPSSILVALNKKSSLHPPSKLLYRCLATTDLLVGLITQPLYTIFWMSLVHKNWTLCQFIREQCTVGGVSMSYLLCTKIYDAACDHLQKKNYSSHEVIIDGITSILMYFNSTLNPFLYCWKVREVRQAVKQTIRQALLSMELDIDSRSRQTCINQAQFEGKEKKRQNETNTISQHLLSFRCFSICLFIILNSK